jgi:hypothetical protein
MTTWSTDARPQAHERAIQSLPLNPARFLSYLRQLLMKTSGASARTPVRQPPTAAPAIVHEYGGRELRALRAQI